MTYPPQQGGQGHYPYWQNPYWQDPAWQEHHGYRRPTAPPSWWSAHNHAAGSHPGSDQQQWQQPPIPPASPARGRRTGMWAGISAVAAAGVVLLVLALTAPGFPLSADEDSDGAPVGDVTSRQAQSPSPRAPSSSTSATSRTTRSTPRWPTSSVPIGPAGTRAEARELVRELLRAVDTGDAAAARQKLCPYAISAVTDTVNELAASEATLEVTGITETDEHYLLDVTGTVDGNTEYGAIGTFEQRDRLCVLTVIVT